MLHRAASNAYSWWWASHIRTKQSKWLEGNLQDMEDRVGEMLGIIENNGDSFAERVDMFYRKRPELIIHVEESYRSYRALAERFDHLSKDLQSANRTIATVFPEQVQYSMDDDEYDDYCEENKAATPEPISIVPNPKIPRVPTLPRKEFKRATFFSQKKQLSRIASSAAKAAVCPPSSGLTEEEALEEVDKLQKEILALQTEKEFAQSVYERCQAKCNGIEDQVTEKLERISRLEDEFGISKVLDDNEARELMAETALKSCQETLVNLEEKQEKTAEEAERESQRIKQAQKKFRALREKFQLGDADSQAGYDDDAVVDDDDDGEAKTEKIGQAYKEMLRERIKKKLDDDADTNSSLTVLQLADRIDRAVEKVVTLETTVSSQDALISRLRSDADGLEEHVRTLEEDQETAIMECTEDLSKKLKEVEEELSRVKILNEKITVQNNKLVTRLTEANCIIEFLWLKLQSVKPDEEVETPGFDEELRAILDDKPVKAVEEVDEEKLKLTSHEKNDTSLTEPEAEKLDEKKDLWIHSFLEGMRADVDVNNGDQDQPNWRHLLENGLEDREKLLLKEYSSVLKNYKDVRKKLGDVEKKNRDGFFELALQIRELKSALAVRDEEIQSLRKANSPVPVAQTSPDSVANLTPFMDSNISSMSTPQTEWRGRYGELGAPSDTKRHAGKEARNEMKMRTYPASPIEEKFRSDIDELLEENLEFWLRFSSSFHQIQKFQNSVQDLKTELSKLKDYKKPEGTSANKQILMTEARPIYRHLRDIRTELTLWLENNLVLKDEMQGRRASLCSIQEELARIISHPSSKEEEGELSEYQTAKFQGEIMNMKQENNKVGNELRAGLDRVRELKVEVERTLEKLDEELGLSATKLRGSPLRARIPLRSFLFGVKLKKQRAQKLPPRASLFGCVGPSLQKQNSTIAQLPGSPD